MENKIMTKMTEKEMYEVIKSVVAGSEFEAEIVELCDRKMKQIEKAKERKAAKALVKAAANKYK